LEHIISLPARIKIILPFNSLHLTDLEVELNSTDWFGGTASILYKVTHNMYGFGLKPRLKKLMILIPVDYECMIRTNKQVKSFTLLYLFFTPTIQLLFGRLLVVCTWIGPT
jgi:hypothetical protein